MNKCNQRIKSTESQAVKEMWNIFAYCLELKANITKEYCKSVCNSQLKNKTGGLDKYVK